jgi:hypothetical protein
MVSYRSIFLSSLLGFAASHTTLFGVTNADWNINGGGSWSVNSNWNPATAPNDDFDTANFPNVNTSPVTISIPNLFVEIQALTIDSPQSYTFISAGGSLVPTQNGTISILNTSGNGAHTIQAPLELNVTDLTAPLQINQQSTSPFTISGDITDTVALGMVYNGPKKMILSGNNSFTSLNITAGTVEIGTPTSLSGAVTNSGKLQLPAGTQHISSFTQNSSGNLTIDYTSPSSFSSLSVAGAASVAGELSISTAGAPLTPATVKIIEAGSLSGTFDSVKLSSSLFRPQLTYGPQTLSLTFVPIVTPAQNTTLPMSKFAILSSSNQTTMTVRNTQRTLVHQIRGQAPVSSKPTKVADNNNNRSSLLNGKSSQLTASNDSIVDPLKGMNYPEDKSSNQQLLADDQTDQAKLKQQILIPKIAQAGAQYPGRFYIGPTFTVGEVDGTDYKQAGAQAGVDYAFTQFGIGALFSYDHLWTKGLLVDQASGTLYASYVPKQLPQIAISGNAGYTYDWFLFHTRKGMDGDLRTAKGTPRGMEFTGLLAIQYIFDSSKFKSVPTGLQISPYASLQYTQIDIDGFEEHGSGIFDLEIQGSRTKQLCSSLELYLYYNKEWKNFRIMPLVSVGWQRELMLSTDNLHFRAADTKDPFTTVKVKKPGRNYAIASIDLQMYFHQRYGIETSWNFEWNELYHDNEFFLGFSLLF